MDLYNLVFKYYWKLNDNGWIFMKNTRLCEIDLYDLIDTCVLVEFPAANDNGGSDSSSSNKIVDKNNESIHLENTNSYVLILASKGCFKYDIVNNTFDKLDIRLKLEYRFLIPTAVLCRKMGTFHVFNNRTHQSIKLEHIV